MNPLLAKPAITAAQVPDAWIAIVRETAQRNGHAVRGGNIDVSLPNSAPARFLYVIEVQSINTGEFGALMLPGDGFTFQTADDRDAVLAKIHRGSLSRP
ncbi:MAG: hypothetical protein HZA93_13100 [Verrucomicrobia bacterium]|nr:hypothetical protein [Verrucomicrobiota bacterium]